MPGALIAAADSDPILIADAVASIVDAAECGEDAAVAVSQTSVHRWDHPEDPWEW